jgi:hypothetical protein
MGMSGVSPWLSDIKATALAAMDENTCNVCVGTGQALSGDCICKGRGTARAEADGLRERLYDEERENRELREALDRIQEARTIIDYAFGELARAQIAERDDG